MAKVKYRVREFTPTANQGGTHSFFAEAVINTDVTADPTDGDDDNTQTGGGTQTPSGELEG